MKIRIEPRNHCGRFKGIRAKFKVSSLSVHKTSRQIHISLYWHRKLYNKILVLVQCQLWSFDFENFATATDNGNTQNYLGQLFSHLVNAPLNKSLLKFFAKKRVLYSTRPAFRKFGSSFYHVYKTFKYSSFHIVYM